MTKGRSKINNCDAEGPPQPRLLRSRKREGPTDPSALPDHVEDIEESFKLVAPTQSASLQPPVQMAVPDTTQNGKDEEEIQGCSSAVPQISHEKGDGLEAQQGSMEITTKQRGEPEETNNGCNADDETASAPKKKRRMGMCAMTEKERSHILQNGAERVERPISNDTPDPRDEEEIQAATIPEQSQAETMPHSEVCRGYDRAETKTCIYPAAPDGINTVRDSRPSHRQSSQSTPGLVPDPGLTQDRNADPPAEREERFESQEQNEPKQSTTETIMETNNHGIEEHNHDGKDFDTNEEVATNSSTTACMNEGDCNATGSTNGSEGKDSHGPNCPPPVSAGPCHPGDVLDSFGSQCLDYVSDSQLNSVTFVNEEVVENDGCLGSSECDEDASHLICGLIRELSSVNRTVMLTYRQLETMRRGSKSVKGPHTHRN